MADVCTCAYLAVVLVLCAHVTATKAQCEGDSPLFLLASPGYSRSIKSPNYPQPYPRNSNCGWILEASQGYNIRVHVLFVSLEQIYDCSFDNVSFYDGDSLNSNQRLATLCTEFGGNKYYYSTGRYMYISFMSDSSVSGTGFKVNYTAVLPSNATTLTTTTLNTTKTQYSEGQSDSSMSIVFKLLIGAGCGVLIGIASSCYCCRKCAKTSPQPRILSALPARRRARAGSAAHRYRSNVFTMSEGRLSAPTPEPREDVARGNSSLADNPPAYADILPSVSVGQSGEATASQHYGIVESMNSAREHRDERAVNDNGSIQPSAPPPYMAYMMTSYPPSAPQPEVAPPSYSESTGRV